MRLKIGLIFICIVCSLLVSCDYIQERYNVPDQPDKMESVTDIEEVEVAETLDIPDNESDGEADSQEVEAKEDSQDQEESDDQQLNDIEANVINEAVNEENHEEIVDEVNEEVSEEDNEETIEEIAEEVVTEIVNYEIVYRLYDFNGDKREYRAIYTDNQIDTVNHATLSQPLPDSERLVILVEENTKRDLLVRLEEAGHIQEGKITGYKELIIVGSGEGVNKSYISLSGVTFDGIQSVGFYNLGLKDGVKVENCDYFHCRNFDLRSIDIQADEEVLLENGRVLSYDPITMTVSGAKRLSLEDTTIESAEMQMDLTEIEYLRMEEVRIDGPNGYGIMRDGVIQGFGKDVVDAQYVIVDNYEMSNVFVKELSFCTLGIESVGRWPYTSGSSGNVNDQRRFRYIMYRDYTSLPIYPEYKYVEPIYVNVLDDTERLRSDYIQLGGYWRANGFAGSHTMSMEEYQEAVDSKTYMMFFLMFGQ